MRHYPLVSFLSLIAFSFGGLKAADTLQLATQIKSARVYFSGAEVSRTGTKYLNKGPHVLVLQGLPFGIKKEGLRATEPNGLRLISIQPESQDGLSFRKNKSLLRMEDSLDLIEYQMKALLLEQQVLNQERSMLLENARFFSEQSGAALPTIQEAASYYRQRLQEIGEKLLAIDRKKDLLAKALEGQNKRMQSEIARLKKPGTTVKLHVDCQRSGNFDFQVSYFLDHAGWNPGYDFRLEEIGKPLDIVYTAEVYQSTGEDWDNVQLSVQAGYPNLSQEAPEIRTWYAGQPTPQPVLEKSTAPAGLEILVKDPEEQPIPFANISLLQNDEMVQGMSSDIDGKALFSGLTAGHYQLVVSSVGYAAVRKVLYLSPGRVAKEVLTLENTSLVLEFMVMEVKTREDDGRKGKANGYKAEASSPDLDREEERVSQGLIVGNYAWDLTGAAQTGLAISYTINETISIPSSGMPQTLQLKVTSQPVGLVYLAAPHLSDDAFLLAELSQWSNLDFLPGPARLFYQGNYRGETQLKPQETGDTLRLSLGRDKSIVLKRSIDKTVDAKRFLSNEVRETVGWFLEVRNNKGMDIKVRLVDQFPVSQNEQLKVDLKEHRDAEINQKLGTLTWEFLLPPGTTEKKYWKYEYRYPR